MRCTLSNQGVKVIWALFRDNYLIYKYCTDKTCTESGIDLIDFRYEQAKGHVAMGYYLATGKIGVCSVPSGPGVTDFFSEINKKEFSSELLHFLVTLCCGS